MCSPLSRIASAALALWVIHRLDVHGRPGAELDDGEVTRIIREAGEPNALAKRFAWCFEDPTLVRPQLVPWNAGEARHKRWGRPGDRNLTEDDFGREVRFPQGLWVHRERIRSPGLGMTLGEYPEVDADQILRDILRMLRSGIAVRRQLPHVIPLSREAEVWDFQRLLGPPLLGPNILGRPVLTREQRSVDMPPADQGAGPAEQGATPTTAPAPDTVPATEQAPA